LRTVKVSEATNLEFPMLMSLPSLCRQLGLPLDQAREVVRRSPALQQLGSRVGAVKGYTPAEAEQIRQAVNNRKSKVKPTAAVAAS
jgi:hypothetical protein